MIDENKPQYVWKNHRMEFKSKDDEKLYKELKAKKRKISLYDFCKNGYKMPNEDLKEINMTKEKAEKEYLNELENGIYKDMEIQEDVLKLRIENEQLKKNDVEKALEVLMDNGNLFFKDYEGKVSPISYCDVDDGKIFFME